MATIQKGQHSDSETLLHTGAGAVRGILLSHNQTTVETTILYDNTESTGTILMKIHAAPERCPVFFWWPEAQKVPFSTGLTVVPGPNTDVHVWWVGH